MTPRKAPGREFSRVSARRTAEGAFLGGGGFFQGTGSSIRACGGPTFAALLAAVGVAGFWGFTVDDAWIVTRVVVRGLEGEGFRFHAEFASDAVTPLGFERWLAFLTATFGDAEADSAFSVARWSGALACAASFALASFRALPVLGVGRFAFCLLGSLPAFIWASAGLATPWVACALVGGVLLWRASSVFAASALGAASAWRPELIPFSVATCVMLELHGPHRRSDSWFRCFGLALGWSVPLVGLTAWRGVQFGHLLPLSALAKVPSFPLGLHYAAVTIVWGGLFGWLLVSPRSGWVRWLLLIHCLALVFAGGDWMPALRLTAPLYPTLIVLWSMRVSEGPHPDEAARWKRWGHWAAAGCVPLGCALLLRIQPDLVRVVERRSELVRQARPLLEGAQAVAAVDVGWVGLAAPHRVVDLGGVTDPRLARVPGSHTNRRLSPGLFSVRGVDAWWVLAWRDLPLEDARSAVYGSDRRLLSEGANHDMEWVATLPLAGTDQEYRLLRR